MNTRKMYIGIGIAVLVVAGWALFRPELLFIDNEVDESFPGASKTGAPSTGSTVLASGEFTGLAHETRGTATVYRMKDGRRVLRLSDFETSNGPALRVYMVAAEKASDNDTVKNAGFVDLGALKGNVGDQNYELPASVDLAKHRSVAIWCARFSVNFGSASLSSTRDTTPVAAAPASEIATGQFHGVAHETSGKATVYRFADGKRVLRFTEFTTSNGPDLRVFMIAAEDATDSDTVKKAGHVEIARLKGNQGDQNYDLPADLDLAKYRAVTIWCNRFGVNFATAPLSAVGKTAGAAPARALTPLGVAGRPTGRE